MTVNEHRTSGRLLFAVAMLAVVAMPRASFAVQLDYTCDVAANILSAGDERLQFSLAGETIGAAALLANLACFVGDRRCSCLRNATDSDRNENTQFAREVGRIIGGCFVSSPNRTLSGISQEAVLNVCR